MKRHSSLPANSTRSKSKETRQSPTPPLTGWGFVLRDVCARCLVIDDAFKNTDGFVFVL